MKVKIFIKIIYKYRWYGIGIKIKDLTLFLKREEDHSCVRTGSYRFLPVKSSLNRFKISSEWFRMSLNEVWYKFALHSNKHNDHERARLEHLERTMTTGSAR